MIEIRKVIFEKAETEHLEYRILQGYVDASGALNIMRAEWGPWTRVPEVDGTHPAIVPTLSKDRP